MFGRKKSPEEERVSDASVAIEEVRHELATMTATEIMEPTAGPANPDVGKIDPVSIDPDSTVDPNHIQKYREMCAELGVRPAVKVQDAEFVRFLQREEIPVFPYIAAREHLAKKCAALNAKNADRGNVTRGWRDWEVRELLIPRVGDDPKAARADEYYWDLIPMKALQIMKRINEGFAPNKVEFKVMGMVERVAHPDPFLLARAGEKYFVVDYWAEPDFDLIAAPAHNEP